MAFLRSVPAAPGLPFRPAIALRPPFIAAKADGMSCALPYGKPEWAPTPANNAG